MLVKKIIKLLMDKRRLTLMWKVISHPMVKKKLKI